MKHLLYIPLCLLSLLLGACTKYNFVEGADPIAHHNKTMWEYFQSDPYNWDLTMELIEHAGLKSVFDGTSQYGSNITFFGITSHSIRRYLYAKEQQEGTGQLYAVTDLPVQDCRRWILMNIYPQRMKLDEWPEGRPSSNAEELIGVGGEKFTMASNEELWIYVYRSPFNGVVEKGPKKINLVSLDVQRQKQTFVASHDISTNTGVVHALSYSFTLNDF